MQPTPHRNAFTLTADYFWYLPGCLVVTVIMNIIVFLAIFGLCNPDKPAYVGTLPDGSQKLYSTLGDGEQEGAQKLSNVHSKFAYWCLSGFIMVLVGAMLASITIPMYNSLDKSGKSFLIAMGWRLFAMLALGWLLLGVIFRFCSKGKYASGDVRPDDKTEDQWEKVLSDRESLFQYNTGKFMKIFFSITFSTMILGLFTIMISRCCNISLSS